MMNIIEIQQKLKQRPPFQMIEKVLELRPGEYAKGIKCVSVNEPYFLGHFPEAPIMPGVLLIETAAQLCSLAVTEQPDDDKLYVLLKCDGFKFIKPVLPGDTLVIEATKSGGGAGLIKFDVKIFVDEELRVKGSLAFTGVDKSSIYQSNDK